MTYTQNLENMGVTAAVLFHFGTAAALRRAGRSRLFRKGRIVKDRSLSHR